MTLVDLKALILLWQGFYRTLDPQFPLVRHKVSRNQLQRCSSIGLVASSPDFPTSVIDQVAAMCLPTSYYNKST